MKKDEKDVLAGMICSAALRIGGSEDSPCSNMLLNIFGHERFHFFFPNKISEYLERAMK